MDKKLILVLRNKSLKFYSLPYNKDYGEEEIA